MADVAIHLWFERDMEAAVARYVALVPGSAIERRAAVPQDSPSGAADTIGMLSFTLAGRPFHAIEAGPLDAFSHAMSIMVECDTQDEIDRLWDGLAADGGQEERCGWLRDRWGVSWQIVPRMLGQAIGGSDRTRARRVGAAMMTMRRLDIAALERAARGEQG